MSWNETCSAAYRKARLQADKAGLPYYVIGGFFRGFRTSLSPTRDEAAEPQCFQVKPSATT